MPCGNDDDLKDGLDYETCMFNPRLEYFNAPLMRNSETIEQPADLSTTTKKFTQEAIHFIKQNKDKPFFLYMAHTAPHVPLFSSCEFRNKSLRGIYGDVVEELDWSVGEILVTLKQNGRDNNTFVVFTSDNGPWTTFKDQGGSAGLLSGGKGGTYEGGMREPAIFRWPGKLKPGVIMDIATSMDLLPTICKLANMKLPKDRIYDGYDISPVLFGTGKDPRDIVLYYRDVQVFAIRKGAYKAHFMTQPEYNDETVTIHDPPLLLNLNVDPSEKNNIAIKNPEIISEMKAILKQHLATVIKVENQLEK